MMRILILSLALIGASPLYANWLEDIWRSELRMEAMQGNLLGNQSQMIGLDRDMLSTQKDIDTLMKQVNGHLTGHSGWGEYQFKDYQSYGSNTHDWSGVLHLADQGRGEGALGLAMGGIASQYPIDKTAYNQGVADIKSQQYYAMKSQTVLAARAASELDYNKIQDQITYQQMLQQQIEKTADLKAAIDLSNRIQVEGNLINLEILRLTALVNQQQAITEQATVNSALANAKFLTKQTGVRHEKAN
jgi:hypothetical protein